MLTLPSKHVVIKDTALSENQFELYKTVVREAKAAGRGAMLAAIGKLLRLCAHPYALLSAYDSNRDHFQECPKLETTMQIIQEIKTKQEKVIVFTDFIKVQFVLQNAIRNKLGFGQILLTVIRKKIDRQ